MEMVLIETLKKQKNVVAMTRMNQESIIIAMNWHNGYQRWRLFALITLLLSSSPSVTAFTVPNGSLASQKELLGPFCSRLHAAKKQEQNDESSKDPKRQNRPEGIKPKRNVSKGKVINSISETRGSSPQPVNTSENQKGTNTETNPKRQKKESLVRPLPLESTKQGSSPRKEKPLSREKKTYSSLLPPPLPSYKGSNDDDLSSGLSSWEEFLGKSREEEKKGRAVVKTSQSPQDIRLPSISDLFPPDLTTGIVNDTSKATRKPKVNALDGVLPVSELFYRSTKALSNEEKEDGGDDEELPFSAEQSDELSTDGNRIQVRRNKAEILDEMAYDKKDRAPLRRRSISGRKMVRRGMEMLVGGVPINADPPQRSIELVYRSPLDDEGVDWASAISLNSRDFGPLMHSASIDSVTQIERSLFCENFVSSAMKWDVCPKDLRDIVKAHALRRPESSNGGSYSKLLDEMRPRQPNEPIRSNVGKNNTIEVIDEHDFQWRDSEFQFKFSLGVAKDELVSGDEEEDGGILGRVLLHTISLIAKNKLADDDFKLKLHTMTLSNTETDVTSISMKFHLEHKSMQDTPDDLTHIADTISPIMMQALNDGTFMLAMAETAKEEMAWPQKVRDLIVEECLFSDEDEDGHIDATDDFDNVDGDSPPELSEEVLQLITDDHSGDDVVDDNGIVSPFGIPGMSIYTNGDLFLGGGNDGVFFDYSESNIMNSPFKGSLGPLLVDAVVEQAKQRYPRVIAIGDVHGCIDELQDLLRECDYQPGDLVVFLGDLVCKGPDSISVIQMAREIGAIGVRGNHDFEVVRWHQAIKSGVDPPVVGSEHFHIATCLTKADMKWLYSLPWYLSSKELGCLFVHAGFVSGIRLAKQNPRLMMNMRSILPDGTVTSKFFSNWPWARLWDGPQTVLFGHDADRGLQSYEHAIGLDTGCVYGGRLTACILPEKRLVSVSAKREYFKYRRKHYD